MTSRTFLKSILGLFCAPAGVKAVAEKPKLACLLPEGEVVTVGQFLVVRDGVFRWETIRDHADCASEEVLVEHASSKWEPILKGLNYIKE